MDVFEYQAPHKIEEAVELLANAKGKAKPLSGGTDLIVQMKENQITVDTIVDISCIPELKKLEVTEDGVKIGATVTHSELCKWAKDNSVYRALYEASISVGTPQVRNLASVIGNLCNAVPSADLGAPVMIFDAIVCITGKNGSKKLPVKQFFTGPKRTILNDDEIVTHIVLPILKSGTSGYIKHSPRKASDLAMVGVAVYLDLDSSGKIKNIKIGLGAVAPTPILIEEANTFIGEVFDDKVVKECAKLAADGCSPITDFRASAKYRRDIVAVNVEKLLKKCALEQMGGSKE